MGKVRDAAPRSHIVFASANSAAALWHIRVTYMYFTAGR